MMILALAFSSCSEKKAKEIFEVAQFEELQKNQEHAVQLYEEIIKKYPLLPEEDLFKLLVALISFYKSGFSFSTARI